MDMGILNAIWGFIKLPIKWLNCISRGIGGFGKDVYVSPLSEISYPRRISLGSGVVLERHSRLYANGKSARIKIGDYTAIHPYALLKTDGGTIEIGSYSSVNDYTILLGYGNIKIGDHVHISAHVSMVASEHIYEKLGTFDFSQDMRGSGIVIENNVWIGINAVILDGVSIGTGSVIGAGAVVTKNIPPYSVAVGVPAKVIKKWK